MKIRMVCLEDGIMAVGFRKMSAYVERLNPDTHTHFVSTNNWRSMTGVLRGAAGGALDDEGVNEIAEGLADADLVGLSSMTGYAELARRVMRRLRELSPSTYLIWGGVHSIIHPENAIEADVDAICTGEGEFAFEQFLARFREGSDFTGTENFWFKRDGRVIKNGFLPLMDEEQMEGLPFPKFGEGEWLYQRGQGFQPLTHADYVRATGLGYNTVWSIGCPFHCTFCGNTKFIANDPQYRRIRHPSAKYITEEVKEARRKLPFLSTIAFHDDSFMAIPYRQIREFAERWHADVGLPFVVLGLIPNYVRQDKLEVLTWAGLNRVRMGIQSGSEKILDFYKRPTPREKIVEAARVNASFSPQFHIPPTYDIIVDNPIETREDVIDTLELLYELDRPYTLNVYSLKVIPNTELERLLKERGLDIEEISSNFFVIPPRWANLLVYLLTFWRPPRSLFERLLRRVEPGNNQAKLYPILGAILRTLFFVRRGLGHLRVMDFSIIPGWGGYVAWRLGLVAFWRRFLTPRPPKPSDHDPPSTAPAVRQHPLTA